MNINDRAPNFRNSEGKLYVVRCFKCGEEYGRENYMPMAATGICAWCGWTEGDDQHGSVRSGSH